MKQKYNQNHYTPIQLKIPADLEKIIEISDPIYTFNEIMKGNKIYSPKTCILVPQRINMLFMNKPNKYGLPTGIKPTDSGRYDAKYNGKHLGTFDTVEQAELAHEEAKRKAIKEVAEEYRQFIPDKVYRALLAW